MVTFREDRYDAMCYRSCGRSGLKLPAISLGFWQSLGELGNERLCREVMYHAFDRGITHFDFANNYGPPPGHSEETAGRVLPDMPRDELVISTKAGFRMWNGPYQDGGSRKYLISSLDASLRRLRLDYVDIFYHHRFDPETPLEETMAALDQIVRSGKALYVGVSNYNAEQLARACEIIRRNNLTPLTIHQPLMNMLVRVHEKELLPVTDREGIGVIPFCPLAQGALTEKYLGGIPADSRRGRQGEAGEQWYREREKEGVWEKVRQLAAIAQRRGQPLAAMALAWLLRDRRVTSVLIGVSSVAQLDANLAALEKPEFSAEELAEIEGVLGRTVE